MHWRLESNSSCSSCLFIDWDHRSRNYKWYQSQLGINFWTKQQILGVLDDFGLLGLILGHFGWQEKHFGWTRKAFSHDLNQLRVKDQFSVTRNRSRLTRNRFRVHFVSFRVKSHFSLKSFLVKKIGERLQ